MAPEVSAGTKTTLEARPPRQGLFYAAGPRESTPVILDEGDHDNDFQRDPVIGKGTNRRFKRNSIGGLSKSTTTDVPTLKGTQPGRSIATPKKFFGEKTPTVATCTWNNEILCFMFSLVYILMILYHA
jgi:hypothetical protein